GNGGCPRGSKSVRLLSSAIPKRPPSSEVESVGPHRPDDASVVATGRELPGWGWVWRTGSRPGSSDGPARRDDPGGGERGARSVASHPQSLGEGGADPGHRDPRGPPPVHPHRDRGGRPADGAARVTGSPVWMTPPATTRA